MPVCVRYYSEVVSVAEVIRFLQQGGCRVVEICEVVCHGPD